MNKPRSEFGQAFCLSKIARVENCKLQATKRKELQRVELKKEAFKTICELP